MSDKTKSDQRLAFFAMLMAFASAIDDVAELCQVKDDDGNETAALKEACFNAIRKATDEASRLLEMQSYE